MTNMIMLHVCDVKIGLRKYASLYFTSRSRNLGLLWNHPPCYPQYPTSPICVRISQRRLPDKHMVDEPDKRNQLA